MSTLSRRRSRDSCAFASSPTDRACNLRRSANLGSELEQRAERSISDSSPTCLLGALYQSDLLLLTLRRRASIIIPSLGLSGYDKSCTPQPFCVATLLSLHCFHNDRRKMIKAREGLRLRSSGCSITALWHSNWCSSVFFSFFSFTPPKALHHTGNYNIIIMYNASQAVVLLPTLITKIKRCGRPGVI